MHISTGEATHTNQHTPHQQRLTHCTTMHVRHESLITSAQEASASKTTQQINEIS